MEEPQQLTSVEASKLISLGCMIHFVWLLFAICIVFHLIFR